MARLRLALCSLLPERAFLIDKLPTVRADLVRVDEDWQVRTEIRK